jgi:hypothetical protein
MEKMPQAVVDHLDKALVAELSMIDAQGRPRTSEAAHRLTPARASNH